MAKVLVVGASGTVGSALVERLRAKGEEVVRATSRPALESDQVHLALPSGEERGRAFEGVDRLFLLSPPGFTQGDVLLNPLVDEAKARGLRKVILMTAMGADADESLPLRKAERHLEASGLAYNILRPNWFMQNFHTFWIQGILSQGKILLPVGRAKGSFIDARDIAAVAAELFTTTRFDGRAFDLTGSQALDHDEVAVILSRESGRTITYEEVSPEAMREGLLHAGLPRDYAEFLLVILGYFKAGYAERITDAVETITGAAPRSFENYAREYRKAW